MNRNEAVKLVEELLTLYANKKQNNVKELMLYQRGYLTGILADIIRDDFYAAGKIQSKIAQAKKH